MSVYISRDGNWQTHLIILCHKFVEALLNDVVAVKILDKSYDMEAQGEDDRVDLIC